MEKTSTTYPIFTSFPFPSISSWYAEVWHPWHLLHPSSPSCQVQSTTLLVSIFTISHLDPQNSSLHLNSLPPAPLVTHLTYNLNKHLIPLLKHNTAPPLKCTTPHAGSWAAVFGPSLPSSHICSCDSSTPVPCFCQLRTTDTLPVCTTAFCPHLHLPIFLSHYSPHPP